MACWYRSAKKKSAGEHAAKSSKIGNRLGCAGLIIPVAHTLYTQEVNTEDTVDFIVACIGFTPGAGWVICGIYTVADAGTVVVPDKKMSTHAEEVLIRKWKEFNDGLRAWLQIFFDRINYKINSAAPQSAQSNEHSPVY